MPPRMHRVSRPQLPMEAMETLVEQNRLYCNMYRRWEIC